MSKQEIFIRFNGDTAYGVHHKEVYRIIKEDMGIDEIPATPKFPPTLSPLPLPGGAVDKLKALGGVVVIHREGVN